MSESRGFYMKNSKQFYKVCLSLGVAFMLIIGFCLPFSAPNTASAAQGDNNNGSDSPDDSNGDSGGFTIHSDKVEGNMDLLSSLAGDVKISEGKIYGLTITKELDTGSKEGPLIIKIKSPGPVPVEKLEAKAPGGPHFGGLCVSEHLGWLCLTDVSMTVTNQTVETIDLPNATVETCYKQCSEDEGNNGQTLNTLMSKNGMENPDDIKNLKDMAKELDKFKDQLGSVNQLIDKAKQQQGDAAKLVAPLQQLIDKAKNSLSQPNDFITSVQNLGSQYGQLNETVSDLDLTLRNANDILGMISQRLDADKKRFNELVKKAEEESKKNDKDKKFESLEKAIEVQKDKQKVKQDKADENSKDEKATTKDNGKNDDQQRNQKNDDQSKVRDDDPAKVKENIKNLKKQFAAIEQKMKDTQKSIDTLNGQKQQLMDHLTTFYQAIQQLADTAKKSKDQYNYSDDQMKAIANALDVAQPGKAFENDTSKIQKQIQDTSNLIAKTKKQQDDFGKQIDQLHQLIDHASKAVDQPDQLKSMAEEIGKQNKQLDENMKDLTQPVKQMNSNLEQMPKWIDQSVKKLDDLTEQLDLPKKFAEQNRMEASVEKQNSYRSKLKKNIESWKKQLADAKDGVKDLQNNVGQLDKQNQAFEENRKTIDQAIDGLKDALMHSRDNYTTDQLKSILSDLGISNPNVSGGSDSSKDDNGHPDQTNGSGHSGNGVSTVGGNRDHPSASNGTGGSKESSDNSGHDQNTSGGNTSKQAERVEDLTNQINHIQKDVQEDVDKNRLKNLKDDLGKLKAIQTELEKMKKNNHNLDHQIAKAEQNIHDIAKQAKNNLSHSHGLLKVVGRLTGDVTKLLDDLLK